MGTKLERKLNFIHLSSLSLGREEQHEKFQCFLFPLQLGQAGKIKPWVFL